MQLGGSWGRVWDQLSSNWAAAAQWLGSSWAAFAQQFGGRLRSCWWAVGGEEQFGTKVMKDGQ